LAARYLAAEDALLQEFVLYLKIAPCHGLHPTRVNLKEVRGIYAFDNPSPIAAWVRFFGDAAARMAGSGLVIQKDREGGDQRSSFRVLIAS